MSARLSTVHGLETGGAGRPPHNLTSPYVVRLQPHHVIAKPQPLPAPPQKVHAAVTVWSARGNRA